LIIGYRDAVRKITGSCFPNLMLLLGDDTFLQCELLRILKDSLRSSGEVDVIEWGAADEGEDEGGNGGRPLAFDLQSITTALPFWFSRRLIVSPSSAFSVIVPHLRVLDAPDSPLVVAFLYPKKGVSPKKLSGYVGEKGGWIVECVMKGGDLRQWAADEAGSLGVGLPTEAFSYLSFLCGSSAAFMSQEIKKVAVYLGGGSNITVDSLKAVGYRSDASSIFELVDAVVEKRPSEVKVKLDALMEQGQAPHMASFMVSRHFIQLLESVMLYEERKIKNSGDLARELGIHPYPAEKLWQQTGSANASIVTAVLRSLLDADLMMKTGRGDAVLLLESILAETVNMMPQQPV